MVKSPTGAMYLTGRWAINEEVHGRTLGRLLYILVEVLFLTCGFGVALVVFLIHSSFVSGYFGLSIGGLISGYMFTTRTFKYLSNYKIIMKIYEKELKNGQKGQKIKDESAPVKAKSE